MKLTFTFLLVLVNTVLVFTQECSPTFKEVYHFKEGDCFIYSSTYWIGPYSDRFIRTTDTMESYIILHRIEQGDTLKYIRKGVRKLLQLEIPFDPGPGSSETDTIRNSTTLFQDTIQYIDSDSNFLNKCEGYLFDVTKIIGECRNCQPYRYLTSVNVELNDSLQIKKAGGMNNFFQIDSAGSIIDTVAFPVFGQQIRVEKSYAKGLGMIHELLGDDETSRPGNLIAYHKNTAGNPPLEINILNGDALIIKTGSTIILRATKNASYHYQWFRNGSVLKGPSGDTLVVSDPGAYQVFITTDENELNFSAICRVSVSGLVAWYPFNGNSTDETGHGYDMNLVNAELTTDRFGKQNSAYLLDDNDYISFQKPFLLNPDSALSLLAWTNYAGNEESLINWLNTIPILSQNARLFIQSLAGRYSDGNWHFFAVICNDDSISLYVNSDLIKSVATDSSLRNILFGQLQKDPFLPFFKGKIDDIRVYNYALSEQEIVALYGKQNTDIHLVFGDVDSNSFVQAYDAALTLQYSVGLDPLPAIDPLPWEPWRIAIADVDSVTGILAIDASLILQKAIGLITQFPIENAMDNEQLNNADVDLKVENNAIVFYSKGSLFGLNIISDNTGNTLGTPFVLDNKMIFAFNNQNNNYSIGIATAQSPDENTAILKIPFTNNTGSITFSMFVNTRPKQVTVTVATGMIEFSDDSIIIFPSPATDYLTIRGIVKSTCAKIYSLNGQLLQTTLLNDPADDINISNLPNGTYIIKLQTDKVIAVKRFVKQ